MSKDTVDKALARLLGVQEKLERATLAAEQAQSRIVAAGVSLERVGRAISQMAAELDRLHVLRRRR